MPVFAPTNSTTAPFSLKLSATHNAGIACPPVPPPAIRIRGRSEMRIGLSRSFTVLRYPVQDAHGGEADQKARTAVAYEGQRHPGEREDDHSGTYVEDRLYGEHRGDARRHAPAQHRRRVEGDPEPGQRYEAEGGDHRYHTQEAELLPDEREDHVRPEFRHRGALAARTGAGPEETARLYGDHGLYYLVTRAVSGGPGVEKRHEPFAPVGRQQHDGDERHES